MAPATSGLMNTDSDLADIPITQIARIIDLVETALSAEGVDTEARERVRNRLVWGNPEGGVTR